MVTSPLWQLISLATLTLVSSPSFGQGSTHQSLPSQSESDGSGSDTERASRPLTMNRQWPKGELSKLLTLSHARSGETETLHPQAEEEPNAGYKPIKCYFIRVRYQWNDTPNPGMRFVWICRKPGGTGGMRWTRIKEKTTIDCALSTRHGVIDLIVPQNLIPDSASVIQAQLCCRHGTLLLICSNIIDVTLKRDHK